MKSLRVLAIATSVLLWIASLRLPAVVLQMTMPDGSGANASRIPIGLDANTGLQMLAFSFWGFTQSNFAGFANFLLILGWFLLWRMARPSLVKVLTTPSPQYQQGIVAPAPGLTRYTPPSRTLPILTRILLGLALLLTLQTFQLHTGPVYYDEGGTKLGYLHALLPGWYLWVLSIAIPFAASLHTPQQANEA